MAENSSRWNWAGTYHYQAASVQQPTTAEQVRALVAESPRVRALGTRHCFNDLADSPAGVLLSTHRLNRILSLNTDGPHPTVTIEPGVTYGQLGEFLHAAGWALPNLASLPHISVAGAVATGTHGSGERLGCLSTSVAGMELVTADGSLRTLSRGDECFNAAVVHLGSLGIVTRLTLDLVPTFNITQHVYDHVPLGAFLQHLDAIVASTYSVSAFTDWQHERFGTVWMKSLAGQPHFDLRQIGGTLAETQRHPIEQNAGNVASEGAGAEACTLQRGIPGPWHQRLPHFRMEFTPSSGEEIQSEFFVPRDRATQAIAALAPLREALGHMLQVSEVRFIAADPLWLSMAYERPSVALHFTWRKDPAGVAALLPHLEAALAPSDARPHWGKVFTVPANRLASLYPRFQACRELIHSWDPQGKFSNPLLQRVGLQPAPSST